MANKKISELTGLASPSSDDIIPIVEDTTAETKKIKFSDLTGSFLTSESDPLFNAASSAYNTHIASGAIHFADAVSDTKTYGRKDGAWAEVEGGGDYTGYERDNTKASISLVPFQSPGTIYLENGETAIVGTNTEFLDGSSPLSMSYVYGFYLKETNNWYWVNTITNDTTATLSEAFDGTTGNYNFYTFSSITSGDYSVALGINSIALGGYSIALGINSTSSGQSSTALGANSTASGTNSTALGQGSRASGDYSIALGTNSTASGDYSITLGTNSKASGAYHIALGTSALTFGRKSNPTFNAVEASGALFCSGAALWYKGGSGTLTQVAPA